VLAEVFLININYNKMKNLIEDKIFVNFKNMTNEERGSLISSHKKEIEDYFGVDLIIHKYGQQPQNENQMLSYKVEYSGISELINIVEFKPRV
jgi:hypothetical protein